MENILFFSLPSFFRLFSKANRSLDVSLQSQPKKLQKKKPEYIQVSTMFERDLPDTTCYNWATKPYFWGSKGLTGYNPSRPKQFFLKYTSPVRNISTYLLLKGNSCFLVSVSIFRDKVERSFFVIYWIRCFKLLSCFINMFLAAYINQFFSSRNENDQHGFQVWEWYSSL